ncbi:hypothetical protein GCM10022224_056380 [Nonomuraea antimicrobica]|uniref:Uncharacterized protein n=1 Tax=Nonomuraea antimicrobica TaxID=561173 RepID=A0ABP7CC87_9ACTN
MSATWASCAPRRWCVDLAMCPTVIIISLAFALAYGPPTIVATQGVAEHEQGWPEGCCTPPSHSGSPPASQ